MTLKAKKALAAALVGAGLFSASAAGLAQETRFYAGGSFGQAELGDFCRDLRVVATGVGGTISSCDDKDSAWKAFVGYRVHPNFALEGTYIDFGELTASGQSFGVPFAARASATAWGAAAVGIVPVGSRFSLFGKLGVLITDGSVSSSGAGGVFADDTSDSGLHLGFGALFNVNRAFSIRGEWERENENKIDLMTLGVQLNF